MTAKLKVFSTAIGFHDAYVAAPSKKAALKAWGTTKDLFARGAAEIVTDPELTREPLASPGEVFKLSRGSTAEQMAALGKDKSARAAPSNRRCARSRSPRRHAPTVARSTRPKPRCAMPRPSNAAR